MKTFKQFLDLLSEAPLPPEVERSIAASVNKGYRYKTSWRNPSDSIISSVRKETGYELPEETPHGVSRTVVADDDPLQVHIYGHENDQSPTVHKIPTVTKIAVGLLRNFNDRDRDAPPNTTSKKQNQHEFNLRNKFSVLLPHPNDKEHHYINNFEHGVLAPSFYAGSGGSYLVAGKVHRLHGSRDEQSEKIKEWTKTKDHHGVTLDEYGKVIRDTTHPNPIVRQHQEYRRATGDYDVHTGNLGGYTDPVSGKTKLVILDAGQ